MVRQNKPFVDKRNATVYRLVHNQGEDDQAGVAKQMTLQMVSGEEDYLGTEKEYAEKLRREAREAAGMGRGAELGDVVEYEEYEEDELFEDDDGEYFDDDFGDEEEAGGGRRKERGEMTQLERDIDELGLPDDGYNYCQHLRNKGQGLFLEAHVSREMGEMIKRKAELRAKMLTKAEKEVIELLENDDEEEEEEEEEDDDAAPSLEDDDAAPSLEDGEDRGGGVKKVAKKKGKGDEELPKEPPKKIVVEGDLPDDILDFLDGPEEEYVQGRCEWEMPPQRLLDERFDVLMGKYDDELIGELDDDHPGLVPPGSEESYYALLDSYIAMGKAPALDTGPKEKFDAEEYEEQIEPGEEERDELVTRTRALILKHEEDGDEGEQEEVVVEEREQWDCESILSTYSNIYNRPKIIHDSQKPRKIKLHPVTGAPMEDKTVKEEEEEEEEEDKEGGVGEEKSVIMIDKRVKGESAEDKKERKALAKQVKAHAREKKKAKALAAAAATNGKPPTSGGADPRTRPGLSVIRYVT